MCVSALAKEQDSLRRKYEELSQSYREKSRRLLQTQELYDKVKRKAEMGHIQRAASDAVDSSISSVPEGASHMLNGFPPHEHFDGRDSMGPPFAQGHRFDVSTGVNTAAPRSAPNQHDDDMRWPRFGGAPRGKFGFQYHHLISLTPLADISGTPMAGGTLRQRIGGHAFNGASGQSAIASTPAPMANSNRNGPGIAAPSFAPSRGGLSGVGLTSGLKVSQPTHQSALDAPARTL